VTGQQRVLIEIVIRALQMVVNGLKHYLQSSELKDKTEQLPRP
jgi:hypothetical protein